MLKENAFELNGFSGCRVFMRVTNSWCWRLNGAAWVGGEESRKPIWCAEKTSNPPPPQENLILQRGELVWTVAGFLVMPKVSGS